MTKKEFIQHFICNSNSSALIVEQEHNAIYWATKGYSSAHEYLYDEAESAWEYIEATFKEREYDN